MERELRGQGLENGIFLDDHNDLEMLEYCTGVAMGNALDEVKAAAEFVTDTNDNDGVAKFLAQIQG